MPENSVCFFKISYAKHGENGFVERFKIKGSTVGKIVFKRCMFELMMVNPIIPDSKNGIKYFQKMTYSLTQNLCYSDDFINIQITKYPIHSGISKHLESQNFIDLFNLYKKDKKRQPYSRKSISMSAPSSVGSVPGDSWKKLI